MDCSLCFIAYPQTHIKNAQLISFSKPFYFAKGRAGTLNGTTWTSPRGAKYFNRNTTGLIFCFLQRCNLEKCQQVFVPSYPGHKGITSFMEEDEHAERSGHESSGQTENSNY